MSNMNYLPEDDFDEVLPLPPPTFVTVENMAVFEKDPRTRITYGIEATCPGDNRMHIHATTRDNRLIEFWLEGNGKPEVTEKFRRGNFKKSDAEAIRQHIIEKQGFFIRKWLEQAKDHVVGKKHMPRWIGFAKKYGFIGKDEII